MVKDTNEKDFHILKYIIDLLDLNSYNIYCHITDNMNYIDYDIELLGHNVKMLVHNAITKYCNNFHIEINQNVYLETLSHKSNLKFIDPVRDTNGVVLDTINNHFITLYREILSKLVNTYIDFYNSILSYVNTNEEKIYFNTYVEPIHKQLLTLYMVPINVL